MKKMVNKKIKNWLIVGLIMVLLSAGIMAAAFFMSGADMDLVMEFGLPIIGIMMGSIVLIALFSAFVSIHLLKKSIRIAEQDHGNVFDDEYDEKERIAASHFYTTKNFFIFEAFASGRVYNRKDIESFEVDTNFYGRRIQNLLKIMLKNGKKIKLQTTLADEAKTVSASANDWLHRDDPSYQKSTDTTVETEEVKDESGNVLYTKVKEPTTSEASGVMTTTDHKGAIIIGIVTVVVIGCLIGLMWFIKGRNASPATTNNTNTNSGGSSTPIETYVSTKAFYDEVIEDIHNTSDYDNVEAYTQYLSYVEGSQKDFAISKYNNDGKTYFLCDNYSDDILSVYVDLNDKDGNNIDYAYFFMIRPGDYQSATLDGSDKNGLVFDYYGYTFMKLDYEVPTFKFDLSYDYNDDYMWTNIVTNNDNCNIDNVRSMAKRYYAFNVLEEFNEDGLYFYDTKTATKYEDNGYEYYNPESALYWADLNTDTKTITIYTMDNGTSTEVESFTME